MRFFLKISLFMILFFILTFIGTAQGDTNLFLDTSSQPDFDILEPDIVMRSRLVSVNFNLLPITQVDLDEAIKGRTLTLRLFADTEFTASITSVSLNSRGRMEWEGTIDGVENSSVIIIYKDQLMIANIVVPGAFYQLRNVGANVHSVRQIDQSKFIPCEVVGEEDEGTTSSISNNNSNLMWDNGSEIDVMVVYTEQAKGGIGGKEQMEQLIDLAIKET